MSDKEIKIPPFVQDYLNEVNGKGFADFVKLSAEYQKEMEGYPEKYATQSANLKDYNRRNGYNKTLNYEDGQSEIDNRFKQRAYQTAKQHGFTGPDPNQPSDKAFTKQGEKFQSMMDQVRQRQSEPKTKQQSEEAREKKNIHTIKDQPSYQQNQPSVTFDSKKQEQSSPTSQQSREQQRAEFLAEIKQTRNQQSQRQQDNQPDT
jgi:hypothetical protein